MCTLTLTEMWPFAKPQLYFFVVFGEADRMLILATCTMYSSNLEVSHIPLVFGISSSCARHLHSSTHYYPSGCATLVVNELNVA